MNLGRRAVLLAGLPSTVPGSTVNRFCASSLETVRMAFHAIAAGEGDAFVAAGVESASYVSAPEGRRRRSAPALLRRRRGVADVYIPMGITAENVAERFAVCREDDGPLRAALAGAGGRGAGLRLFRAEITPLRADVVERTTVRAQSSTSRARGAGAGVPAGRASPRATRARSMTVPRPSSLSDRKAREFGIVPRARMASAVAGIAPEIMGVGPIRPFADARGAGA